MAEVAVLPKIALAWAMAWCVGWGTELHPYPGVLLAYFLSERFHRKDGESFRFILNLWQCPLPFCAFVPFCGHLHSIKNLASGTLARSLFSLIRFDNLNLRTQAVGHDVRIPGVGSLHVVGEEAILGGLRLDVNLLAVIDGA